MVLGRLLHWGALAVAAAAVAMAVVWSDHGEGGGYATPLAVLAGLHRLALAAIFNSWSDDSVRAAGNLLLRELSAYTLLQAGLFLAVAIVVALPGIRRRLTPAALKKRMSKPSSDLFVIS